MSKKSRVPSHIENKGNKIASELKDGANYVDYKGKRLMMVDRNLVSIKLNQTSRLLFNLVSKQFQILTHSQYNKVIGCKKG